MLSSFRKQHIKRFISLPSFQNEITLTGYQKHKTSVNAPAPLTMREEEIKEMKRIEINTDINTESRQRTLGGVSFPITESASNAVMDMKRGSYNYLQFLIKLQEEQIDLVKAGNIDMQQLPKHIPDEHARYSISFVNFYI